ncbi:MAG: DUF2460 domain-containing protein [Pseudomonadota bacterium]
MAGFHDVRFPSAIARGSAGGPERRTDVVVLGSGHEERNARWADSRRVYNAGYGVKSLDDLHAVIAFFEERRGRLYAFRWKDFSDCHSGAPLVPPSPLDQVIGTGDGVTRAFSLTKTYGGAHAPWVRAITKPVAGGVRVAVDGVEVSAPGGFALDALHGTVTFEEAATPAAGAVVTAGFTFDVPVRFDTDRLEVDVQGVTHGAIPNIPIVEVRL